MNKTVLCPECGYEMELYGIFESIQYLLRKD